MQRRTIALAFSFSLLVLTSAAPAQQVSREEMWWAPTAADWKKPVLITWQRTWKDAVVVAKETGKPILICINMDGEIASEHYAGVRYRMPDICKLYEPYVCVIVSVYRHNPRDHDDKGQRIPCPRFGGVTCGEHMMIEQGIFEKFCDGQRVAPRHIMVEVNGKEAYDVYYTNDTDSVFAAVKKGIAERNKELTRQVRARAERTLLERVRSRDTGDRSSVEAAYLQGDKAARRQLLEEALAHPEAAQVDLLRLAIFGLDVELSQLAQKALVRTDSERSIDLIHETFRVPMDVSGRDDLIAALQRLGEKFPRARTLATIHQGFTSQSDAVDVTTWAKALETAEKRAPKPWSALEARLEYQEQAAKAQPQDPNTRLECAVASLALAVDPNTPLKLGTNERASGKHQRLMLQDARRSADDARQLGAKGWKLDAVLAISSYYLGDQERAHKHAEAAVKSLPKGEQSWNAMAVLGIFAEARVHQIWQAVRAKKEWPGQWLTDVHAAYAVLARHPLGTDSQVVAHHDFLQRLGAKKRAATALEAGLVRFPDSWVLHDRLRGQILAEKGVDGLEPAYQAWLEKQDAPKHLEWFAGFASIVAAEFHRRAGKKEEALAAYDRAIAHFDRCAKQHPETQATSDHYAAIALAGRARLAYERRDQEEAVKAILASFARCPDAAGSLDGLSITPVQTAQMLRARLRRLDLDELKAKLDAALDKLPPKAFVEPFYERDARNDPLEQRRR